MQFQAFNKILIEDQKIRQFTVDGIPMGWEFRIRYPSYRGTYLSCIEKFDLYLDGEKVDPKNMVFILDGKEYLMEQMKDQYKTYWFVLDYATLRVITGEVLPAGLHDVTIDMYHRIPYGGYSGGYLGLPSKVTKTLVMQVSH